MGALTTTIGNLEIPLNQNGDPEFGGGFGPIGGYPTLPDLGAPPLPSVTVAPTPANNGVNFQNPLLNSAATAINSGINTIKSGGGVLQWIENNIENLVFIILGFMLIAAGIFSFKQTQTIIREGGKAAAAAAGAAAVAA